jgi:hypothetical protein
MRASIRAAFVGVSVVMIAGRGEATETRVRTLQNQEGIVDETRVFDYPGELPQHHVALVELGTAANQDVYGAAFYGQGQVAGGVAVSRDSWLVTDGLLGTQLSLLDRFETAMTSTDNGGPVLPKAQRPVELLGAFKLGRDEAIGLRLGSASYQKSDKTDPGTGASETKISAQQADLTLGLALAPAGGVLDVSATTHITAKQKHTETANDVESGTELKGKSAIDLTARWIGARDASAPYVGARVVSQSFKVATDSATVHESSSFSDTALALQGGYAVVSKPRNAKLFTGLSVAQTKSKGPTVAGTGTKAVPSYLARGDKATVKANLVNGELAGEGDVGGGFGAMVGLSYALYGTVTEQDNTTGKNEKSVVSIEETPDANLWSLGMYYRAEALRVDASYSKAFLHNGPYLIAGNQTSPLFGRLSVSYTF